MNKTLKTNVIVALVAVLVTALVVFFSTKAVVGKVPTIDGGSDVVASSDLGEMSATELYEKMKAKVGYTFLLESIDSAILNDVVEVTDEMNEEVDANIQSLKDNYGDSFADLLAQNGIADEAELRELFLLDTLRNAYVEAEVEKTITEESINTAYEALPAEIGASHILIRPVDESEEADATALATAMDLIAQLDAGADFAELASEYSEDTGSAVNGGDLGLFSTGTMVAEFEDAAFALGLNEYSATPVKTQYGYHIILKTVEETKASLEESREELVSTLVTEALTVDANLGQKLLHELRVANGFEIVDAELDTIYTSVIESME